MAQKLKNSSRIGISQKTSLTNKDLKIKWSKIGMRELSIKMWVGHQILVERIGIFGKNGEERKW